MPVGMIASAKSEAAEGSLSTRPMAVQWLRLGVLQNGRLLEERMVPAGREASVGTSPGCTVVLAADGVGRRWRLFARQRGRGGSRLLRLAPGMQARLAVASAVTMVSAGAADGTRVVALAPSTRGRIAVGDVTILFQLLAPPPPQPRPRLPASVRGSLRDRLDAWFTGVALASLLCHLALVLYLRTVDWPRTVDVEAVPDRFVHMPPVLAVRPPPAPTAGPTPAPAPATRPDRADRPTRPAAPAMTGEEGRRRLVEDVNRLGLLKIVGALGDHSQVANLLRPGGVDRSQEEVLRDVGGLTVASAGTLPGVRLRDTASGGRLAQVRDLRDLDVGRIASAVDVGPARERRVEAVVRVDPPAVNEGTADAPALAAITREIRLRLSGVRACYERALRRNPQLGGKLTLRFTISPAGTVTAVDIDDESVGDAELVDCLRALLLRWRFAPPGAGGPVEISFPFVFQPVS
jgi:TonB family protein